MPSHDSTRPLRCQSPFGAEPKTPVLRTAGAVSPVKARRAASPCAIRKEQAAKREYFGSSCGLSPHTVDRLIRCIQGGYCRRGFQRRIEDYILAVVAVISVFHMFGSQHNKVKSKAWMCAHAPLLRSECKQQRLSFLS